MKNYFDSISEYFQNELAKSAMSYLKIGLDLFHLSNRKLITIQAPIGNLGTATELMLKTYVSKKNPLLLFKGLPNELKILFSSLGKYPKNFKWRLYDIDLRSFSYKTIELDECISIFNIFFPEHKQFLKPYFRFLSSCRNISLHASIPSFQIYDLERTSYLALNIYKILNNKKTFGYHAYSQTEKDKEFISVFNAKRSNRVRKKMEEAKEKSKQLTSQTIFSSIEGWDFFSTSCPICNSEGVLTGYTDMWVTGSDENNIDYGLNFYADSFECSDCGLILDDVEELKLVGMDTEYDRSFEWDNWIEEHPGPSLEDI
ncbi:MAG: hypothetical protein ACOC56_02505 [Atribacterota bacterium]